MHYARSKWYLRLLWRTGTACRVSTWCRFISVQLLLTFLKFNLSQKYHLLCMYKKIGLGLGLGSFFLFFLITQWRASFTQPAAVRGGAIYRPGVDTAGFDTARSHMTGNIPWGTGGPPVFPGIIWMVLLIAVDSSLARCLQSALKGCPLPTPAFGSNLRGLWRNTQGWRGHHSLLNVQSNAVSQRREPEVRGQSRGSSDRWVTTLSAMEWFTINAADERRAD